MQFPWLNLTALLPVLLHLPSTHAQTIKEPVDYFPPPTDDWETIDPAEIGWDAGRLQAALDFAGQQRSTGVVVLHRGRILAEQYWKLTGKNSSKFNQRTIGEDATGRGIEDVASVQKSVAAILVGIAQEKGLLDIEDPVSKYLGEGWSRATASQEQAILIRHLLTMTSGLTDRGEFKAKPGAEWKYNTRAYAKSVEVVAAAAKMDRHELTAAWLTHRIGMTNSSWQSRGAIGELAGNSYGFATTARDLARFGLLVQRQGKWNDQQILSDVEYLHAATTSSQRLNPHYGYLWWVSNNRFDTKAKSRPEAAPADMISAKGALTRRCYVVPSLDLVVTRLGDQPQAGKAFDQELWSLIMAAAPKPTE